MPPVTAGTAAKPAASSGLVREEKDWNLLYGEQIDTSAPIRFVSSADVQAADLVKSSPVRRPPPSRQSSPSKKPRLGLRPGNDWRQRLQAVHKQNQIVKTVTTAKGSLMIVPMKRGRGRPPKNAPAVPAQKILMIPPLLPKADGASIEEPFAMERPLHYIRHIPTFDSKTFDVDGAPLDDAYGVVSRILGGIEYDMDEQDFAWLRLLNEERKSRSVSRLPEDAFEFCMDRLEKYWFHLTKAYQRWQSSLEHSHAAPEDFLCEICGDGETTSTNLIVMCDECDLAVHQDCYGVVHIPEGPWLCRRCYVGQSDCSQAKCSLCPWPDGALKQTTDSRRPWAHLTCAHYLPGEAHILNASFQEPIDIGHVHSGRHNLTCIYCRRKGIQSGTPVQCASKTCHLAFHPLCARTAGALMDHAKQQILCWKHSYAERPIPLATSPVRNPAHTDGEGDDIDVVNVETPTRRGRGRPRVKNKPGQLATPVPGPIPPIPFIEIPSPTRHKKANPAKTKPVWLLEPIAPRIIIDRLLESSDLITLLELVDPEDAALRTEIVTVISKYWALRKSAKRGQPLLRPLQMEPWSSSNIASSEESIKEHRETRQYILNDLRRLETVSGAMVELEKNRLRSFSSVQEGFQLASEPMTIIMRIVLRFAAQQDPNSFFAHPVPLDLVPDYLDVITDPMDFFAMAHKVENQEYESFPQFLADLELIWKNAMTYNLPETVYYQAARTLEEAVRPLIANAKMTLKELKISRPGQISLPLLSLLTLSSNGKEEKAAPKKAATPQPKKTASPPTGGKAVRSSRKR